MRRRRPSYGPAFLARLAALALAVRVDAQFRQRGRSFGNIRAGQVATEKDFDGSFHFCRIYLPQRLPRRQPRRVVERGLAARRHQPVDPVVGAHRDHGRHDGNGEPNHLLLRLTDDVLYHCPFIMMTEVGSASLNEAEAAKLRDYLLKGGFLWADDFWGGYAWEWWEAQFRRVLPAAEYPIVELPRDHPLFHSHFQVQRTPQIAVDQLLGGERRQHLGARRRQRRGPHARDPRRARGASWC